MKRMYPVSPYAADEAKDYPPECETCSGHGTVDIEIKCPDCAPPDTVSIQLTREEAEALLRSYGTPGIVEARAKLRTALTAPHSPEQEQTRVCPGCGGTNNHHHTNCHGTGRITSEAIPRNRSPRAGANAVSNLQPPITNADPGHGRDAHEHSRLPRPLPRNRASPI